VGIEEGKEEEEIQVVVARCDIACGEGRAGEEIEPGVFPYAGTHGGDDGTPRLKVAILNNGGGVNETEYSRKTSQARGREVPGREGQGPRRPRTPSASLTS
jgi:hypothetical protein